MQMQLKDESKEIQTKNYTKIQITKESWAQCLFFSFGDKIFLSLDKTIGKLL